MRRIIEEIGIWKERLSKGEFEFSEMPLDEWIKALSESAKEISDNKEDYIRSIIVLLKYASESGSIDVLVAVLEQIRAFLSSVQIIWEDREIADNYAWIVFHRLPGYNYFLNNRRNEMYLGNKMIIESPFVGKGVVYTVITGDYDTINVPKAVKKEWDYVLFTDNKTVVSDFWQIRYLDDKELDPVRLSRKPKILGHKYLNEYDYSIYIDGKIIISGDIDEYIRKYSKGLPMLCVGHYMNIDIYEEASLCKYLGKDNQEIVDRQINKYKAEGFPSGFGLTENCIMIRTLHNEKLNRTMELWWEELCGFSSRDQLSFTYCCWKNGLLFDIAPVLVDENPYFTIVAHK